MILQIALDTPLRRVFDYRPPAEFFAVVTEAFFERPRALRAKHPELYAELARFFRQDPVRYTAELTTIG